MKKRIICILLTAVMLLTLIPITAFAADNYNYTITNGTPESAKETNHGYIFIDKTAAEKDETVTITVYPEEGYKLKAKSLTVVPTGFVDLGIKDAEGKPLYWKETNLGASNPQDPGDYYMWGATTLMYSAVDRSKTDGAFTFVTENPYGDNYKNTWNADLGFVWNNVPFTDGVFENNDGKRNVFTKYTTIDEYAKSGTPDNIATLQPEDDAATAENENWRMPTLDEFKTLAANCVLIYTSDYKSTDTKGYIVYKAKNEADKGKANANGKWKMWDAANSKYITNTGSDPTGYSTSDIHIFLPFAGIGSENKLNNLNTGGIYWSSTLGSSDDLAYTLTAMSGGIQMIAGQRQYGYSVRPVMSAEITPVKQDNVTYQFEMPDYNVTVTAEFEVTIADILPSNFPASDEDNSWCKSENDNIYIYKTDSDLVFNDSIENIYNIPLSSPLTKEENPKVSYVYSKDGTEIQFNMTGDNNDELDSIIVSNCTNTSCIGTYAAPEAFSVTYNANGATSGSAPANQTKIAGVDLTLATNTGNLAKADYTFAGWNTKADGKGTHYDTGATYTTDAALTLYAEWIEAPATKTIADILPENFPTSSSTAWKTQQGINTCHLDSPSSCLMFYYEKGGYTAATTATVTPSGNDYVYTDEDGSVTFNMKDGKLTSITAKFNDDDKTYVYALRFGVTVNGGDYVVWYLVDKGTAYSVSGNTLTVGDITETAGAIEGKEFDCWKIGETVVTEGGTITADTIFTAVYKAAHTHNPVKVNGQAATETASGWKDYYKCDCDALFEDKNGSTPIDNLDTWKAEGGNGYIAKLKPAPEPEPDPINYKIIEGAQSTWTLDDGTSPSFRSNADFSKFVRVELDGKVLDPANYTAKPGSTIITLKPEFAAKLAPGKHTIEIVSTDGSASTVFYIEETIANTNGEGFALSTATMSSAFIGCTIVGLAVVFFELKKKKIK